MQHWKDFFQTYRVVKINSDDDLLYQVGTTVGGKPISAKQHNVIINSIVNGLDLKEEDEILDLCCGNGIITYDLGKLCASVIGVDSSMPYIENAIKHKSNKKVKYYCDDVINFNKYCESGKVTKALIYSAIAYFSEEELSQLFAKLNESGIQKIFIGSVLDDNEKFSYFNTFQRLINYLINYRLLGRDLGLGKWWKQRKIKEIAKEHGYSFELIKQDQSLHTSHYRFDCILTKA